MPKREKKGKTTLQPQKITNVIEWLKHSRRTHDLNMLRMLITGYTSWKIAGEELNESLFEKTYKLKPIPTEYSIRYATLNRTLNYEKVEQDLLKRNFFLKEGETLNNVNIRELIKSLLPRYLADMEDFVDSEERKMMEYRRSSFSYALSRIVIEKVPRITELSIMNKGLDTLSSAVLTLYAITNAVNQNIPWLYNIWNFEINRIKAKSLEMILDSLSSKSDMDTIEAALERADEGFNRFLAQEGERGLFEDPFSKKIRDWIKDVKNDKKKIIQRKKNLRENVSKEIQFLKGFSAYLTREIYVQGDALTHWPIVSLRADGPISYTHESLLRNIRNEINILRYQPIYNLCSLLSSSENPNQPTGYDLERISEFKGRTAFYTINEIEQLLIQQYLPSFKKMGLRYRYIFTPRQRPGVLSDGLIERMILLKKIEADDGQVREKKNTEPDIRGCTIHLEPSWSKGPNIRSYEKGTLEAVVEEETISLNLSLFNSENGNWLLAPPDVDSKPKRRNKGLISRTTTTSSDDPVVLSDRQIELLSLLWSIPMSRHQRKSLLERAEYPQRTANRMLRQMLHEKTLRLVYLPALELTSLTDGFIIMAHCNDRRSRNDLIDSIQWNLPFARVLMGDSNDVVAHARVPSKKSDIFGLRIENSMKEYATNSFLARQRSMKTYRMTALHRIHNRRSKKWKDPWKQSI